MHIYDTHVSLYVSYSVHKASLISIPNLIPLSTPHTAVGKAAYMSHCITTVLLSTPHRDEPNVKLNSKSESNRSPTGHFGSIFHEPRYRDSRRSYIRNCLTSYMTAIIHYLKNVLSLLDVYFLFRACGAVRPRKSKGEYRRYII